MAKKSSTETRGLRFNVNFVALSLVGLIIFGVVLSLAFEYGPTFDGWDSYLYSYFSYTMVHSGSRSLLITPFTTKSILMLGMASIYALFGVSALSDALFGLILFALSIPIVFYFGKLIRGTRCGLISAALFSFMPVVVINASAGGDDLQKLFFTMLAMLFLVIGMSSKKRRWFFLASFIGFLGAIAGSDDVYLIFLVMFPVLLVHSVRNWKKDGAASIISFLCGIAAALFVFLFLDFVLFGNPYAYFSIRLQNTYLNAISYPTSPYLEYVALLFPYISRSFSIGTAANPISSVLNKIFVNPFFMLGNNILPNYFGYFGLLLTFSLIFLLVRKERKAYLLIFWFAALLLYLCFGPASYKSYVFVLFEERFSIILAPPICLMIAYALDMFLLDIKKSSAALGVKQFALFILAVFMVVIFISSVMTIAYQKYYRFAANVYPAMEIGSILNGLPINASVYVVSGFVNNTAGGDINALVDSSYGAPGNFNRLHPFILTFYSSYERQFDVTLFALSNCSQLEHGSYFITVNSIWADYRFVSAESRISSCSNAEIIYRPLAPKFPAYIQQSELEIPGTTYSLYYIK